MEEKICILLIPELLTQLLKSREDFPKIGIVWQCLFCDRLALGPFIGWGEGIWELLASGANASRQSEGQAVHSNVSKPF